MPYFANQLLGICALTPPSPQPLQTDPTLQKIIDLATNLTPSQRRKALKVLELFSDENSDAPAPL